MSMLAEFSLAFPWYSWVCLGLLIVIVVVWKIQQNKQV